MCVELDTALHECIVNGYRRSMRLLVNVNNAGERRRISGTEDNEVITKKGNEIRYVYKIFQTTALVRWQSNLTEMSKEGIDDFTP